MLLDARVELADFEPALVNVDSQRGLRLYIPEGRSVPHAELRELTARHGFTANRFSFGLRFQQTLMAFVEDPLSTFGPSALSWILLPTPLAFLILGWRARRKHVPKTTVRLSPGKGVVVGLLIGVLALGIAWVLETALAAIGFPVEEQGIVLALLDEGGSVRYAFIAVAVLLAPVGEELFFRSFAFGSLLEHRGPLVAHLVSGGLFTAVHFNPSGVAIYFLLAVVLAESYRRSGRLLVSMIAHGVFNATTVAMYLSGS